MAQKDIAFRTTRTSLRSRLFRKTVAFPQEHGTWAFLLSPLIIGIVAGGVWTANTTWLVVGVLAAFMARQPVVMLAKIWGHRRPRTELPAALFWLGVYGSIALVAALVLVTRGYTFLLYLAVPAVFVLLWYLYLIRHRAERRQLGLEIVGSGALALGAPAALWVARGHYDPVGWGLWLLSWFQSAASIVYIYLRLEQRRWSTIPPLKERLRAGSRALLYTTTNMGGVALLSAVGLLPPFLWVAYAIQWVESVIGTVYPATHMRPTVLGIRQMLVSTLFTVAFVVAWLQGY